jgi:hypothetical protein
MSVSDITTTERMIPLAETYVSNSDIMRSGAREIDAAATAHTVISTPERKNRTPMLVGSVALFVGVLLAFLMTRSPDSPKSVGAVQPAQTPASAQDSPKEDPKDAQRDDDALSEVAVAAEADAAKADSAKGDSAKSDDQKAAGTATREEQPPGAQLAGNTAPSQARGTPTKLPAPAAKPAARPQWKPRSAALVAPAPSPTPAPAPKPKPGALDLGF